MTPRAEILAMLAREGPRHGAYIALTTRLGHAVHGHLRATERDGIVMGEASRYCGRPARLYRRTPKGREVTS